MIIVQLKFTKSVVQKGQGHIFRAEMSADNDLPELVDVNVEAATYEPKKEVAKEEDDFKPVMSKRKRRQEKMETEEAKKKQQVVEEDDDEDDEEQIDMEELEEILDDKAEDDQPLKKIKFPPLSNEKVADNYPIISNFQPNN